MMTTHTEWRPNFEGGPDHPDNAAFVAGWQLACVAAADIAKYQSTGRDDAYKRIRDLINRADDGIAQLHNIAGGCDHCNKQAVWFDEGMGDQWCDDHAPGGEG